MGLSKIILNIALWLVDTFTFFIKTDEKRITFISLTANELKDDFYLLDRELKKEEYHIYYDLIVFEKGVVGKFKYFLNCLQQLVEMKKSKLIILNDNNYIVSNRKPKDTKVIQIWHAPGAVKKFGNQIKRQYPIRNYDACICNSSYWKPVYAQAFGMDENKIHVTGFPRMDTIHNADNEFIKKHPECKGKRLILYAPTFRGNIIDGFVVESMDFTKLNIDENTYILCKYHPLLEDIHIHHDQVLNVTHEDLYDLMNVSDLLISDYSSVFFDFCLIDKPMIVYVPDYENYKQTIGLNMDIYKEFKYVCTTMDELNQLIASDLKVDEQFQQKFVPFKDGKNTERVVEVIKNLMK